MRDLKKFITRTVCNISAGIMATVSVGSFFVKKQDDDILKNRIYQERIIEDLDANMELMYNKKSSKAKIQNKGIVRLKPNDDNKIYVEIQDNVEPRAKDNVEKVLNEFNEIFEYINDRYNFVACSEIEAEKQRAQSKTTLSVEYRYFDSETTSGRNVSDITNYSLLTENGKQVNTYVYSGLISLNSLLFDSLPDESQRYVIKHELLHSLGFADMYEGYKDETSIMNSRLRDFSEHISPNDFKMLYCAYGDKHIKADGQYDYWKVLEIKNKINEYSEHFYNYLMNNLKKKTRKEFKPLKAEDYENKTFEKEDVVITINDDKEFEYRCNDVIKKGRLIVGEDYAIVPDIQFKDMENNYLVLVKRDKEVECLDVAFVLGYYTAEGFEDDIIMRCMPTLK